jgi:hypothetical protein
VVRVPGYRPRGRWFDSRRYQILWEVVGLERSPLSLVSTTGKLLEINMKKTEITAVGIRRADHVAPSIRKFGTNFINKRRSFGRYNSLADSDREVVLARNLLEISFASFHFRSRITWWRHYEELTNNELQMAVTSYGFGNCGFNEFSKVCGVPKVETKVRIWMVWGL